MNATKVYVVSLYFIYTITFLSEIYMLFSLDEFVNPVRVLKLVVAFSMICILSIGHKKTQIAVKISAFIPFMAGLLAVLSYLVLFYFERTNELSDYRLLIGLVDFCLALYLFLGATRLLDDKP